MMDILLTVLACVVGIFIISTFLSKRTMPCIDDKCDGTMESFIYIGVGDGPAPDHIHFECKKCGRREQILQ